VRMVSIGAASAWSGPIEPIGLVGMCAARLLDREHAWPPSHMSARRVGSRGSVNSFFSWLAGSGDGPMGLAP
jgi:hypothetical protein